MSREKVHKVIIVCGITDCPYNGKDKGLQINNCTCNAIYIVEGVGCTRYKWWKETKKI